MPIAFSYSRFSSRAQASGDSLRRQLSAAFEYAEANDLTLDTTLQDHGVSGYSGANRTKGALASFLRRIEAGEIEQGSFLLIDSMDRLSREKVVEATHQLLGIALAGITVVTLNDGRKFDRNANLVDMILSVAEIERSHRESAEKGRKVAKAHGESKRRAREEGRIWSRNGPSWLQFDEASKAFQPIPEKVAVLQRIFDLIESGWGTQAIARLFNEEGVPQPKHGACGWFDSTILKMVRYRSLLGEYQPMKICYRPDGARYREADGEPIPEYYGKAVIDPAQFYRVQTVVTGRSKSKGRGNNTRTFDNLLIGMVRCNACGGPVGMHIQHNQPNRKPVLRCTGAVRGVCKSSVRIAYPPIEQALFAFVREWEIPTNRPKNNPVRDLVTQAQGIVADLAEKVGNLTDQAESGSKAIAARLAQREAELEAAQKHLAEVEGELRAQAVELPLAGRQEALCALMAKMEGADPDQLYGLRAAISQALRGVVANIVFHGLPTLAQPGINDGKPVRGDFLQIYMVNDHRRYTLMTHRNAPADFFYQDDTMPERTIRVLSGPYGELKMTFAA